MPNKPDGPVEMDMDMTPMIDIVFQLIIFFMLVSEMTQTQLLPVDVPKATKAVEDDEAAPGRLVLSVDRDGNVFVQKGDPLSNRDLKMLLKAESDMDKPKNGLSNRSVLIRADRDAPYRYIQKITLLCVDPEIMIWNISFGATRKGLAGGG